MKKTPADIIQHIVDIAIWILIGIICSMLLIKFVGQLTSVDGTSMEPGLENGDYLMIDKLSYQFSDPERFDIIVFPVAEDGNKLYIKRVIGLPGETVQIVEGMIYINDKELTEEYHLTGETEGKDASNPVILGEDEYFVLGDNRTVSVDSRTAVVGKVKKDKIIGRACFRVWPLNCFGKLD